jgi:hypothetical protein
MSEPTFYCASCGSEFRPTVTTCPECEQQLISAAEYHRRFPEPDRDDSPSVTVFDTADLGTLELAKSLLESAGIACSVRNERMLGLFPTLQGGPMVAQRFRTAEVQVTEHNEERARAVLDAMEDAVISEEDWRGTAE